MNLHISKKISVFIFFVLFTLNGWSHEIRPAYLQIIQTSETSYEVYWKVPSMGDAVPTIHPVFPPFFKVEELKRPNQIPGSVIYSYKITSKETLHESEEKILFYPDSKKLSYLLKHDFEPPKENMVNEPSAQEIFSLQLIKERVAKVLIGEKLDSGATKNRGQALERMVLDLLGYPNDEKEQLYGGFPDIKNQLLEVKVQDSPTVDLGKFSPEFEEVVIDDLNVTTYDVRYLIALTNPDSEIIEGIILSSGDKLGEVFSYVSDKSYKCQRSIPIKFFDKYSGMSVFNPS